MVIALVISHLAVLVLGGAGGYLYGEKARVEALALAAKAEAAKKAL